MNTNKGKPAQPRTLERSIQDRLIPFPGTKAYPAPEDHSLWAAMARNADNPLVRFVRSVFFYPNDEVRLARRTASGHAYYHGKRLAH